MTTYYNALISLISLLTSLLVIPATSHAYDNSNEYLKHLYHLAESKDAWNSIEWINLLHYQKNSSQTSGYISQVDDTLFFNASDGKNNPESELKKTLESFFNVTDKNNSHSQCKFVARLHWLKNILDIQKDKLPVVECADYIEWRSVIIAERVTLVFPAYHLNSPSSMFGHTLFRLDPAFNDDWSDWLSFAVNFGANINNTDDSIAYAFKGLTGGYPGIFIVTPYYKKIQEYNRIENRDIWEYELNLTTTETERMVKHLWELKEINFDYYFFDENCSYRLLELLEVARPGLELTDQFSVTAIPVDTVRAIANHNLIQKIAYRPSQSTILQNRLNQLTDEEKILVKKLSIDTDTTQDPVFSQLDQVKKKLIIKSSYDYLRYQKTGETRDETSSRKSYQLLKLLNKYPKDLSINPTIKTPSDPQISHESRRINITIGIDDNKNFGEIGYKFSLHDLIDNEIGFLRGAQINLGNINIRTTSDNDLSLNRFDLIDIFSLTARTDFFKPLSWKILTGLERQLTNGKDILVIHVTGGAGVSYNPSKDSLFYTLLMARLENNNELENNIEPAIGFSTGTVFHFTSNTLKIELNGEQFSGYLYRLRASYEHNIVLQRNHSIVLKINRQWQPNDESSKIDLSYHHYF